jgi:hypothetical protein
MYSKGTAMNKDMRSLYRLKKSLFAEVKKINSKQLLGKCAIQQIKGQQMKTKKRRSKIGLERF